MRRLVVLLAAVAASFGVVAITTAQTPSAAPESAVRFPSGYTGDIYVGDVQVWPTVAPTTEAPTTTAASTTSLLATTSTAAATSTSTAAPTTTSTIPATTSTSQAPATSTTAAPTTTAPATTTTAPATTTTVPSAGCAAAPNTPGGADGTGGCFPGPGNTGIPAGTALTVVSGNMTISTANTVIDGKDIRGCVNVTAPGVIIRRSKITCGGFYAVLHESSSGVPLTITDSEITCGGAGTGIGDHGTTVRRVNIHDCENGFDIDDHIIVEDTWIHDLYQNSVAHSDGIQIAVGVEVTIRHNSIFAFAATSAIISHPTNDVNMLVERNLLAGGAYTLYCPRDRSVNFQAIDNRFSRVYYPKGGVYGPWTDCEKIAVNRGNVWADTGQPLPL